ncbi:MAG: hypothetical protein ACFFCS_24930 [Candidatus Hodarchaeota archaeon]
MEDTALIKTEELDALLIYLRMVRILKETRFYQYYRQNPRTITNQINYEKGPNFTQEVKELHDENEEFTRSFVATLRLFTIDNDQFSIGYLGDNLFNDENGSLFNSFSHESKIFNKARIVLNEYFRARTSINLTRIIDGVTYTFDSNWEILQNYLYGGLIHINRDKRAKYNAFNLHKDEGKNVILYNYYIQVVNEILVKLMGTLDFIAVKVIMPIIKKIIEYNDQKVRHYEEKTHLENQRRFLHNNLYIYHYLEDNVHRIEYHQKLIPIYLALNREVMAQNHENKIKDIQRSMEGLPPDFSKYDFRGELRIKFSSGKE